MLNSISAEAAAPTYEELRAAAESYHAVAGGHPVPQIGTLIYQIAGVHFLDQVHPSFYRRLIAEFGKGPPTRNKKPRTL